MSRLSRYRSKPISWWLSTPLYAARYVRHLWRTFWYNLTPYKAQNGEDRILEKRFPHKNGYCVEVGCINGIDISNTYYFEKKREWKCLLIEADPYLVEQCRRNRPKSTVVQAAIVPPGTPERITFEVVEHNRGMSAISFDEAQIRHVEKYEHFASRQIEVPAQTLDQVLEAAQPPHIDFITIDIEGHEWGALQGFDLTRWKPQVIILERRDKTPDARIVDYLTRHGYVKFMTTPIGAIDDCNDWYQRS